MRKEGKSDVLLTGGKARFLSEFLNNLTARASKEPRCARAREYAKRFDWNIITNQWEKEFLKMVSTKTY